MYKKPLLILLFIALLVGGGIFINYQEQTDKIAIDNSNTMANNNPVVENNTTITVYVSGEVNNPGIVDLTSASRISDAIKACGDFTALADKSSVNLAQKVEDGMQIKVLALNDNNANATSSSTANKSISNNANTNIININTANEEELDTLPGIGPAMAKRIIEYRQTNGNFKVIEDIKNVSGIGEAKFTKMQDKITT